MAEVRSKRAIAERLFVTEHTVEKQVKNIDHRRVLVVVTYLGA